MNTTPEMIQNLVNEEYNNQVKNARNNIHVTRR